MRRAPPSSATGVNQRKGYGLVIGYENQEAYIVGICLLERNFVFRQPWHLVRRTGRHYGSFIGIYIVHWKSYRQTETHLFSWSALIASMYVAESVVGLETWGWN